MQQWTLPYLGVLDDVTLINHHQLGRPRQQPRCLALPVPAQPRGGDFHRRAAVLHAGRGD